MKVLVTGGAGFIGSHIVDALVAEGHSVAVVDNFYSGSERNLNPAAKLYRLNVRDDGLSKVFEAERPDAVCHQAAQIVVQRSVEDPIFDASENILGGINVILNCVRFRVGKIVYASSGGTVYGEPKYLPVDEQHPINPLSQYGVSKHTVEHYLALYGADYGLKYVVLRYSNVYGPRQNPKGEAGVVAIFAGLILSGKRPTIFGKGDKTRDYVHVLDVAQANLLALKSDKTTTCNIGTGVETRDQEIFDGLAAILGYRGKPHYAPVRKGEIFRVCLSNEKARREMGWSPKYNLAEGLAQAAEYYRSLR